jgi:hypothetical protein
MAISENIELAARAMCDADGLDPNEVVTGLEHEFLEPDHTGSGMETSWHAPRWKTYARKARHLVAGMKALGFTRAEKA